MSVSSSYSRRSGIRSNLCWLVDARLVLSIADLCSAIQHGLPTKRVNQILIIWQGGPDLCLALAALQQQIATANGFGCFTIISGAACARFYWPRG